MYWNEGAAVENTWSSREMAVFVAAGNSLNLVPPSINVDRCEWPLHRGKLHFYDRNRVTEEMHPKNRTTLLVQESGRCQIWHCKSQISC